MPAISRAGCQHQYSKSYSFEQSFMENAPRNFGSENLSLQPLLALQRAQSPAFFEPHRHYRSVPFPAMQEAGRTRWCGQCPKCLFVRTDSGPISPVTRAGPLIGPAARTIPRGSKDFDGMTRDSPRSNRSNVSERRKKSGARSSGHPAQQTGRTSPAVAAAPLRGADASVTGAKPVESAFSPSDIEGVHGAIQHGTRHSGDLYGTGSAYEGICCKQY
jgi:hypothetical protein